MNRNFVALAIAPAATWFVLFGISRNAAAIDTVIFVPREGAARSASLEGTIIDLTGEALVLQPTQGPQRTFPRERVARIETNWPAEYATAKKALASSQLADAARLLLDANRLESRPWARRAILADLLTTYLRQENYSAAANIYLAILQSDPTAQIHDRAPLVWHGHEAVGAPVAKRWLAGKDRPEVQLLAASHLLRGSEADAARRMLNELTASSHTAIAQLAEAQLWRLEQATADAEQVTRWQQATSQMEPRLRAGPYWLLGQAEARLGESDAAVLHLLRLPLQYSEFQTLATAATEQAAALLRKAGRTEEAERVESFHTSAPLNPPRRHGDHTK